MLNAIARLEAQYVKVDEALAFTLTADETEAAIGNLLQSADQETAREEIRGLRREARRAESLQRTKDSLEGQILALYDAAFERAT